LEVHGDGAVVWLHYTVRVSDSMRDDWSWDDTNKWASRLTAKLKGRFRSRFGSGVEKSPIGYYVFEGHPKNLIELCHDSLVELEEIFRTELATDSKKLS
jgi:hypothetical protein